MRRVRWRRGGGVEGDGARGERGERGDVRDDGGESGRGEGEEEARASAKRVLLDGCPRTAREVSARASAWGACAGAWAGATPIPLDWNRAWQRWPVSVVRGLSFGHVLGITVAMVYVCLADVMGLDPRDGAARRKRR